MASKTYAEALVLLRILVTLGLLVVAAGIIACAVGLLDAVGVMNVFNDPLVNMWTGIKRLVLIVGGIATVIFGVVIIAIARVIEAVVDTATNTAELLVVLRQQYRGSAPQGAN